MNKEKLSQLHHLKNEIELLQKQLDNMDYSIVSDSVKGSSISFPYVQHTIIITGADVEGYECKAGRLKRQLQRRLDEYMDTVTEINEYIASVEDSEMRQILSLRYINNLTWQQIAAHIGTMGDGSTERKKHDRFLIENVGTM